MKKVILEILSEYLKIYPNEKEKISQLYSYLDRHTDEEITDWNNFDGHIVSSGFVYAIKEKKFLLLYHRDLKMYLYPGGHTEKNDPSPLVTSKREVHEETGLSDFKQLKLVDNELIPLDIDIQFIGYNENKNIPEHYHFDFRYIYTIDQITDIYIDEEESADYKWVNLEDLYKDSHYGKIAYKVENIIKATLK